MTNYTKSHGRIERQNSVLFHRYCWNFPEYKVIAQPEISSKLSRLVASSRAGRDAYLRTYGNVADYFQKETRKIAKQIPGSGLAAKLAQVRSEWKRQEELSRARRNLRDLSVHVQTLAYFSEGAFANGYRADRAGVGELQHYPHLRSAFGSKFGSGMIFTPGVRKDST